MRWLGHVKRMPEERMRYKILNEEMDGIRKRGRPRKRCLQSDEKGLRKMKFRNWWEKTSDRNKWRHIVWEAKAPRAVMNWKFMMIRARTFQK